MEVDDRNQGDSTTFCEIIGIISICFQAVPLTILLVRAFLMYSSKVKLRLRVDSNILKWFSKILN